MLSAIVPRKIVGCCGTQAMLLAPEVRAAVREVETADGDAAVRRVDEAEEQARDGRLARSARPDQRDRLAGMELEVERRRARGPAATGRRTRRASNRTGASSGLGATSFRAPCAAGGLVEQLHHPLRDRDPVGARVELRRELPHGEVELRREDEHRQRSLEAEAAVDEPHAGRDGDERDAQRRGQLEHRAREERDAQRADRRPSVALADPVERRRPAPGRG